MSLESPQFVFMTCRAGAEAALKQEVARTQPAWRPAFSRPGFMTFKCGDARLDAHQLAERNWTFAHSCGVSLRKVVGTQLAEMVRQVWGQPGVVALVDSVSKQSAKSKPSPSGREQGEDILASVDSLSPRPFPKGRGRALLHFDIHVWQREPALDAEGNPSFVTPLCLEIKAALRAAVPKAADLHCEVTTPGRATPRDSIVLDVVVVEPGEWWIGYHHAVRRAERWPGGVIPVRMPAHAVSRAYLKLEEALQWSDLPLERDDECVEIGCAPGGASQALLDRGLFVTGIDPADVDEAVLAHPHFRHLKKRGSDVRRYEFTGVRWLTADMNIAPDDTLQEVEAIVTNPQVSIRGIILTLKFSDWSAAARLPEFVERVRGWGYRDVRTRQLVSGGQEICLVALRRKALRRLRGKRHRTAKKRQTRVDEAHSSPAGPHF